MRRSPPRTLHFAYSDPVFMGKISAEVWKATSAYESGMEKLDEEIGGRDGFDGQGLCKGMVDMPFCCDALQPKYIPWVFPCVSGLEDQEQETGTK